MTPAALAAIHAIPLKTKAITIKPQAAPIFSGKPSGFMFVGSPAIIDPSPKRKSRALFPTFPDHVNSQCQYIRGQGLEMISHSPAGMAEIDVALASDTDNTGNGNLQPAGRIAV
jgi:hypothetical protein